MKGVVVHIDASRIRFIIAQAGRDLFASIEVIGNEHVGLGDQLDGELDFLACEYLNNITRTQVLNVSILGIHTTLDEAMRRFNSWSD